jgi:hypothetical protein
MKIYRIQIPASVHISVPAESEEQAKRIAASVAYTPDTPLWGCDNETNRYGSLGVSVWVSDETQSNPSQCEVLDQSDLTEPPIAYELRWLEPLREFAELNNNTAELEKALTQPPPLRCVVVEHDLVIDETGEKLPAHVVDGGEWGDDFDNLASSQPEDPYIYKEVEGTTQPPDCPSRPLTFTQVFLRTRKTNEQLLQEYK